MNRKEKSRKKKKMSKKVLKMVHTQKEPMGWEIFAPLSLSSSAPPPSPSSPYWFYVDGL